MAIKIVKKPPKRKPGARAGLTKAHILEAAAAMIEAHGPVQFSVRALAKKLKVVPTTVHSHFKGGYDQMERAIAQSVLGELAPPYEPLQDPKDYLRKAFRVALDTFRDRPILGRLVMLHAMDDPYLDHAFSERLLVTVEALTAGKKLAEAYALVLVRLAGLILQETGRAAQIEPQEAEARLLKDITTLTLSEFPTLKKAADALATDFLKRTDPGYAEKKADEVVTQLLAELQAIGV